MATDDYNLLEGTWAWIRQIGHTTVLAGPWTFTSQGTGCMYPGFYSKDGTRYIPYHNVAEARR